MTGPVRATPSIPRRAVAVVGAALLVLAVTALVPRSAAASAGAAGDRATFLVLLEPGVDPGQAGRDIAGQHGGQLGFVYRHAVRGFAVTLPEQAADGLARDRRVASVHRDQVFTLAAQTTPTGVARAFAPDNANMDIDGGGPGVDVDIAVLDTGLDMAHEDLNDVGGADCTSTSTTSSTCTEGSYQDGHGHGTHVAGSAAAVDNGVGVVGTAPGARLHGLKVLADDGVGYESWIVAALDWVVAHNTDADGTNDIEVANMSLGCECVSTVQDQAIATAVANGVTVVVAAGNSGKDASTFNPANHPDVITVSALADANGKPGGGGRFNCTFGEKDDTLANFSNWGSQVELAAPGTCIYSTVPGGYGYKSGTSMASPHVAGAVAVLASSRPGATPAQLETLLLSEGNFGWTDDSGDGIHEPLLDMGDATVFTPKMVGETTSDGGGTTQNAAPTAAFTYSCTDLTCTFDGSGSSDSDGSVSSWAWAFGDGGTASGTTTTHTYAAGGTYTVTLTVTDNGGATSTTSQSVAVTAPSSTTFSLTANGYKVKGLQHVDLSWSGATTTNVDVHRNGTVVTTTANDGAHTDSLGKGGGSYTYKVCEASTTTCSNEATVTF